MAAAAGGWRRCGWMCGACTAPPAPQVRLAGVHILLPAGAPRLTRPAERVHHGCLLLHHGWHRAVLLLSNQQLHHSAAAAAAAAAALLHLCHAAAFGGGCTLLAFPPPAGAAVEVALQLVPGVRSAAVSLTVQQAEVRYAPSAGGKAFEQSLVDAVEGCGFEATGGGRMGPPWHAAMPVSCIWFVRHAAPATAPACPTAQFPPSPFLPSSLPFSPLSPPPLPS